MSVGLYLHVPFCVKKCAYCDFPSYAGREEIWQPVLDRMLEEMRLAEGLEIGTIYIGGGTPSVLPVKMLRTLLEAVAYHFRVDRNAEISMEINPGTIDRKKLETLREAGVNRISFGAQAMQEELLHTMGRIHTWKDVQSAVELARSCGFDNCNLDLMYGLPGQTPSMWRDTLEAALELEPKHLSLYSLIVEEGTPFHERYAEHPELLPDEDSVCQMQDDALWITADAGMERYEISNYAQPGWECRHNLDCWQRKNYLGIGCAAHSFMNEQRWSNDATLEGYLAGKRSEIRTIPAEEARFERLMLGLRLVEGIGWGDQDTFDHYEKKLRHLRERGLVEWDAQHVWLTSRGLDLQNQVLVELMD